MTFRKPFRAVPVKLGHYQQRQERRRRVRHAVRLFAIAIGGGMLIGIAGVATSDDGWQALTSIVTRLR